MAETEETPQIDETRLQAIRRRIAKLAGKPDPGPVDIARLVPVTLVIVAILGISSALLIYADIVNPVTLR